MPKLKTKKIAVKRFKITRQGKILHRSQGLRHLRRNKSKARQNRQDKMKQIVNVKYKTKIKKLMHK